MSKYDANIHVWSGLFANNKWNWQKGMREIARGIGHAQYHSTARGYGGYELVAGFAIQRKAKHLLLIGHSNGGYAITRTAEILEPHGIKCTLICLDRTMKSCPDLGSNVPYAWDFYAGLRKMEEGPNFKGVYTLRPFEHLSHIGIQNDPDVQREIIEIGRNWRIKHG